MNALMRRRGALLFSLLITITMISLAGCLVLHVGEKHQHILRKISVESASMELMQDLYRVQTKNYGYGLKTPFLHIDPDADQYSIYDGAASIRTKQFHGVRFHATTMNFFFHQDGSPYSGETIDVGTDDGSLNWRITVLPVTGRIAVKRS